MRVSTAALLLGVMQKDHRFFNKLVKSENDIPKSKDYSFLSSILVLAIAGPLIAKIIEHAFDVTFLGDPDNPDPAKRRGLIGSFYDDYVPDVVKPTSTPKIPDVTHDEPASRVNRGSQVTKNLAKPTIEVDNALRSAAAKEGVDYSLLYALAGAESSFNPSAAAKGSNAVGLLQIIPDTWRSLMRAFPELGYTMADRTNPEKAAVFGAKYVKIIQKKLTAVLGTAPTLGQIYLGYFMGPDGATSFLKAYKDNPNQVGARLFHRAATSNPDIFYDKGEPRSLQQVLDLLSGRVSRYQANAGITTSSPQVMSATPPPVSQSTSPSTSATSKPESNSVSSPRVVVPMQRTLPQTLARPVSQSISPAVSPVKTKIAKYVPTEKSSAQPFILPDDNTSIQPESTYIRDNQGRITEIHT